MGKAEPLGLPRGSVRALLTVFLVVVTGLTWLVQGEPPASLMVLAAVAVVLYFSQRAVEPEAEYVAPVLIGDEDS